MGKKMPSTTRLTVDRATSKTIKGRGRRMLKDEDKIEVWGL